MSVNKKTSLCHLHRFEIPC